jgi:uncharacterized membrane protein YdjX (TVP38/TMEM64 family)
MIRQHGERPVYAAPATTTVTITAQVDVAALAVAVAFGVIVGLLTAVPWWAIAPGALAAYFFFRFVGRQA